MLAGHHNHEKLFAILCISLEIRKLHCFISQFFMSNYMPYLMVIYSFVCPESILHLL